MDGEGKRPIKLDRIIPTAMIYAMNAPGLPRDNALAMNESEMRRMFGYCETHYAYDTCQFKDYDKYAANLFGAAHQQKRLEEQFPIELEQCRELGVRLVQKVIEEKKHLAAGGNDPFEGDAENASGLNLHYHQGLRQYRVILARGSRSQIFRQMRGFL